MSTVAFTQRRGFGGVKTELNTTRHVEEPFVATGRLGMLAWIIDVHVHPQAQPETAVSSSDRSAHLVIRSYDLSSDRTLWSLALHWSSERSNEPALVSLPDLD